MLHAYLRLADTSYTKYSLEPSLSSLFICLFFSYIGGDILSVIKIGFLRQDATVNENFLWYL